jgi:hypothetical protein
MKKSVEKIINQLEASIKNVSDIDHRDMEYTPEYARQTGEVIGWNKAITYIITLLTK